MPTCSYCSCDVVEGFTDGLCGLCRTYLDGMTSTDPEDAQVPDDTEMAAVVANMTKAELTGEEKDTANDVLRE